MEIPIEMQQLGPDFESGIIVEWIKKVGEIVSKGDPLVEVETDKVNVELEALDSGTLSQITAEPGAQVAVGDVVGFLETDD